jgi:hypothetical protein
MERPELRPMAVLRTADDLRAGFFFLEALRLFEDPVRAIVGSLN